MHALHVAGVMPGFGQCYGQLLNGSIHIFPHGHLHEYFQDLGSLFVHA